ncbi:ribosomal-processing cysteine protease Prp [Caldicellulosiruptor naganoensis]|uniref:Ribosomal processing cysteine protease Prp n=1 Tax=Caldicellulosiruptor naganoensis TaxID=29324 RepID=A0ABY7BH49_9FIRM|nr:ribosomal-processing cysteine protease Prp [Caldicellulosiruptor naganoensis]WAM30921.1 ribosomal-processing cysteine protease Prp [Caldicellulosiruptor naganoensis]
MIIATFFKRKKIGYYYKVVVKGHSGFAPRGKDIVCSAVSSVILANVNGCIEILKAVHRIKQESGYLEFEIIDENENVLKESSLLLQTAYLALKEIESQYPKYVKVEVKEDEIGI